MIVNSENTISYLKRNGSLIYGTATAPGGAVAVLRISGKKLDPIKDIVGDFLPANSFALRSIKNPDPNSSLPKILDKALVLFFQAPNSFTGEDVIEIQGHGSPGLLNALSEALDFVGAQKALPGEFSFRAVLNEKMTLAEAEKLNMVLRGDSLGSSAAAKLLTDSGISNKANERLVQALNSVIKARGRVEAAIDFPEAEEEQSAEVEGAQKVLEEALSNMQRLITSYENFVKAGREPTVLILGPPNVGKSTLLNQLIGGERSLVSPSAGTTRDYIDAKLNLPSGRKVRIVDTAGIREVLDLSEHGKIEKEGISAAIRLIQDSDLVIWVENASETKGFEAMEDLFLRLGIHKKACILLKSHADLLKNNQEFDKFGAKLMNFKEITNADELYIYREVEKGLEKNLSFEGNDTFDYEGLVSERQAKLILLATDELRKALACLGENRVIEIVGEHLLSCERKIKDAIGKEVGEDYLGAIFSHFCLGK